ncbi:MAG: hypothetical protein K0S12_2507 [Bacteroidetes bacterium]|jgi:hypothetical protein|nr:hypothetical protein [Bacteroidota bacterium]
MKTVKVLALIFLSVGFNYLMAAPPPPPSGTVGPPCWPPPCVPIDGGVSILIAAGAAYGVKKIYDARKKTSKIS